MKQSYIKVVFKKTIGQFKKDKEYEVSENLAKYWKRYVTISDGIINENIDTKSTPRQAKNKAILKAKKTK